MHKVLSFTEYQKLVGQPLQSEWLLMDQQRISAFAEVTEDRQFIHIDPEKAAQTPFKGTIAHGLLTLSVLPHLVETTFPLLEGMKLSINYGYNKIRFLNPVPSGSHIRANFLIKSFEAIAEDKYQLVTDISVEIEGLNKTALVAEWISIAVV